MSSNDIFQFYAGSADAKPGKGAGETLVSPSSTYAELAKVKDWRRLLATGDDTPLSLTGTAELWEAPPRKPKIRRTDLEEKRSSLSLSTNALKPSETIPEQAIEMADESTTKAKPKTAKEMLAEKSKAKTKPKTKAKAKQEKEEEKETEQAIDFSAVGQIGSVPESMYVSSSSSSSSSSLSSSSSSSTSNVSELAPIPDMEETQTSTIRFCPICRYYLYLDPLSESLVRMCRNCGYRTEDNEGGLVSELLVQQKATESYKILLNEFTRKDPRLPHLRGTIKCPFDGCESNTGNKESDIIYLKYDSVNLLYLYICDVCGFRWHSRR